MTMFGMDDGAYRTLERESVELLQRLLQADTTNPPGNETVAAEVARDYLAASGVAATFAGEQAERQNLVARLRGRRPGPTLLFLGHLDVVPAEPDEWSVPPFSGELRDGWVWGRGAIDMKCQVAAETVAFARLARSGADFGGELVLALTADEERGDHCGARWLVQERPDLVGCDYMVNEGGGTFVRIGNRRLYDITVGEKGFAQFRIVSRGRGGHGSVPLHQHNAVELMGRVITALADYRLPVTVTPFTAQYISRLVEDPELAARLADPAQARTAIADMLAAGDENAYSIEPLLGITFSPTIARAGGPASNVIPSHAELDVDCRILPGHSSADVEREVRRALAGLQGWSFEWVDVTEGNESPVPTPLSESIESVMKRLIPDCDVVPLHLCGFTDSRWFRESLPGVVAYGFCPFLAEDSTEMGGREHAKDERVAAADLPFQALFYESLARDLLR